MRGRLRAFCEYTYNGVAKYTLVNRPLFAGDPEVRILGYGKEQMWKQIFT